MKKLFGTVAEKQNIKEFDKINWAQVFEKDLDSGTSQQKMFRSPLEEMILKRVEWHTTEYMWYHVSTISFVATLPDAERQVSQQRCSCLIQILTLATGVEEQIARISSRRRCGKG